MGLFFFGAYKGPSQKKSPHTVGNGILPSIPRFQAKFDLRHIPMGSQKVGTGLRFGGGKRKKKPLRVQGLFPYISG